MISTMKYDDLINKIEEYLPVRKNEKEKFGEVFTPPLLINELLDNLPKDVWSNPTLKWLDPANGIGNFFIIVYSRLMNGLEKKIPNKNNRSLHILKNMLYMVEINPKNVKISNTIFGKNSNIINKDFLSNHAFEHMKFDIIIGNLPFNEEININNKKNIALWTSFVFKSFQILNEGGYIAFIHPQTWRSPENKTKLWDVLTNKNIIYLHIYGADASKKIFNVNTKVDLYILQNSNNRNTITYVIDETGKINHIKLKELSFLPNYNFKEIIELVDKDYDENNENNIIYDTFYSTSKTKEIKDSKFKYPVISSITNGNKLNLRYTDTKSKGHFNISKVIINGGRFPYPYNDYNGKYGMTQNLFAIPIKSKKQGDDIVKAINSDEFASILKATKWSTFAIDYKLFKYFKKDFYKNFIKSSKKTRKIRI